MIDEEEEIRCNEDKDYSQYKTEGKEKKKKKLSDEGKSMDYIEFERNEGEDDAQSKKRKKKKLSTERKSKEYEVFEKNEGEGDAEGDKERKKKKLCGEDKRKEYNEFENNEGEDDALCRKRKKKKLSKESKSKEYNVFERNEGEDDVKNKKKKKKNKLSEEAKSKEYNEFESNEVEDNAQGKKKKLSKESKSEEYNVFKRNGGESYSEGKKRKKKKLSEEGKSKEYNEFQNNDGEDDAQGRKGEKKKYSKQSKSEEDNVFERNEGEVDAKGKKKKKRKHGEDGKSKEYNEFENNEDEDDAQGKKRKKKKMSKENKSKEYNVFQRNEGEDDFEGRKSKKEKMIEDNKSKNENMMTKKETKADNDESPNPACSGLSKPKRVTFSDQVEVCCDGLVRGKRFTLEEDEQIKSAVYNFIESRGLGDEGLDMVLHCSSHPEVRSCWNEIAAALPHRPKNSVYTRAHILFERSEMRKWTPEEYEFLRKVKEQHGSNWRQVADALGKNRIHVKDAWRRVKLRNTNKGRWTQEEYQKLFDLVNLDLRVRASQGYRKSKHGMLRDNIGWEAIGDKLVTRTSVSCCHKWYDKLRSPMVATGAWSDTDDYRLVDALYNLDACCTEEVDWDDLLEHRTGEACRKRWNQIVRYIGDHGGKSFSEQVEILAKRYCPNLLEVREAFDAKPLVC
ncbi:hypothetical protein LR48_Vigan02g127900 [Vigna angularis]|uniref:Uncharacterized protein n=2 Tax=Vigna TaxID=3913 RepID=A0A0L9TY64_PHAAN|nr:RNA polymerase I termination factor [Vigna angularis]KAG2402708.1 uncharacterized protein HKW66_Vig0239050 [Vigna angularis]KOM35129.1 hypothetical protein LR48_Vigan02g127900 [Vigna angularis]